MYPFDVSRLSQYPDKPGVYLMKDDRGVVLYVGKAKNLKARLRQYYAPGSSDERVQIPALLSKATDIETVLTSSEAEALLLESTLIKRFKPRYNILLKDDRSRLLLRIGMEHEWPRVELVRSKESSNLPPQLFGPFSGYHAAQELFDLTVRLFSIRQCSDEEFRRRTAPCLLYQMRRCTAPCVGKVSKDEYGRQVAAARQFLSGKTLQVRTALRQEMEAASAALEFEKAARLFRSLRLLGAIGESRHELFAPGATDTDVIGSWQDNNRLALAVLHYREATLVFGESWAFDLEESTLNADYLEQLLVQYYLQRSAIDGVPKEILFPEGQWSLDALEELVRNHFGQKVHLRRPEGGAKKALVALACDNAKARLSQSPDFQPNGLHPLESLQHVLSLRRLPRIIDCFDASHFGGQGLVAASVGFVDGKAMKSRYRRFHIRSVGVGDDLSMLREAVSRRYKPKEHAGVDDSQELPDLILVDGGKEHLRAVCKAVRDISFLDVDVVSIAKEHGRHDKGLTADLLYVLHRPPVHLPITSRELLFLQTIRDEAHRFVITFQKKLRIKNTLRSQLETIPGIGPKKCKALLTAFQGLDTIQKATPQEIKERAGLSLKDAAHVLHFLQTGSV